MAEVAISVQNIEKSFGEVRALRGVSIEIERGSVFGLLGPNGAGKSTLIRILTGLSRADEGAGQVLGLEVGRDQKKIKARMGVVPQDNALDRDLTAAQNMKFHGQLFGMNRKDIIDRRIYLMEQFGLSDKWKALVNELSGGLRRRLVVAKSLMHDPEILVLDEPTTGLDPQSRRLLWDQIIELRDAGRTVILTTHYMDEADYLCDRVAIIDGGKIIAEGTPESLKEDMAAEKVVEVRFRDGIDMEEKLEILGKMDHIGEVIAVPPKYRLVTTDSSGLIQLLFRDFEDEIDGVTVHEINLEDVFIKLTGRHLRD